MRIFRFLSDLQRWSWFAAGDDSSATQILPNETSEQNSEGRVLWEVGWIVAIPLALAALVQLVLGALNQ